MREGDLDHLVVALAAGDALVQAAYQHWSGLRATTADQLGFEPGARNIRRFNQTVRWLGQRETASSVPALVIAVLLDWARDRNVAGVVVDATAAAGRMSPPLPSRASFKATTPRPHEVRPTRAPA